MKNVNLTQSDTKEYANKLEQESIDAKDAKYNEAYAGLCADMGADVLANLTEEQLTDLKMMLVG